MFTIFNILDASADTTMHSLISITAWSDDTTIYYDHWEKRVPATRLRTGTHSPAATSDAVYTISSAGGVLLLESSYVPTSPRGTD